MPNDEKKLIKGTNNNDYISPEGHGHIDIGKGKDIVVLSEGDFFSINGFQDSDLNGISKSKAEKVNYLKELFGQEKLQAEQDILLMHIDCKKEHTQSIQYFERGGVTYVQLYDKELDEIVAGARVVGTGFKIDAVGENGSIDIKPQKLIDNEFIDQMANNINEFIAKGEVTKDLSLKGKLQDHFEKTMDEAKTSWNPLDRLASKLYETKKDLGK